MTLQRLSSLIWYFVTHKADHAEVEKFRNRLWVPPKGADIPPESPWSTENETKAFETFQAEATKGASVMR